MHLIKFTNLASLASVAFSQCVRKAKDCPPGTHAEYEPEFCTNIGYPQYQLVCTWNDDYRKVSLGRQSSRDSSRQRPLRKAVTLVSLALVQETA
ncbi:hypothetical protein BGW42_006737, partial [Actinomortierella wolfii]